MKRHPELLKLASVRCRMSIARLIWEALQKQRFCQETFTKIHQQYLYLDEVPLFVEDYALNLLAQEEISRKPYENCLRVRPRYTPRTAI